MSYGENELKKLVGRKVEKIFMNDEYLRFQTKEGNVHLTVEGGCCSHSFFNDFIGVEKLLKNGAVVSVEEIELKKGEIIKCRLSEECTKGDCSSFWFSWGGEQVGYETHQSSPEAYGRAEGTTHG